MVEFIRKQLIKILKWSLNLLQNEPNKLAEENPPDIVLTRADVIAILENETLANDFSHKNLYGIDLSGMDLSECNFASSTLTRANLSQCQFFDADFSHAACREANFAYAELSRANFTFAYLREADFTNAHLYRANLDYADCREAIFELTNIHRASLQGVQIDGDSIGRKLIQDDPVAYRAAFERVFRYRTDKERAQRTIDYYVQVRRKIAQQVYRDLKIAFTNNGRYAAASWAYVRERQARRQMHFPLRARIHFPQQYPGSGKFLLLRRFVFYGDHFLSWVLDWIAELTCGYGEKPLRPLVLSAIILVIFPFIYAWEGGVKSTTDIMMPLDYFNYSLAAFTTLGFSEFEATTAGAQTLTSLEALLGISILALLMFVLGNRISRV
ncbi:MAG: pentapeptide repeat-containing protein [Anaerolineae bacterium]|nr:pentapeptide repeat-containing protein [Anaerolineae bacterium]